MTRATAFALCACLLVQPLPAFASRGLEGQVYNAASRFETMADLPALDDVLLAQVVKQEVDIDIEVKHEHARERFLSKRQKRTMLGFMFVGGLAGALFGGIIGFITGFFGSGVLWYALDGAELLPSSWR